MAVNVEMALANGVPLDVIEWFRNDAPDLECQDCISEEVPYRNGHGDFGMVQTHDDSCPRWKAAARRKNGGEFKVGKKYRIRREGNWGVWMGEEIIACRMLARPVYVVSVSENESADMRMSEEETVL